MGLTLGFWLITSSTKIVIDNPMIDEYEQLKDEKGTECPYSQLNVPYGAFVRLETSLHGICSSDFVTDRWVGIIFASTNASDAYRADFRVTGSAQFLALGAFCRPSCRISVDSITSFYFTSLRSPQALTRDDLEWLVELSVLQFQETMPSSFQSRVRLTNRLIFSNKLLPSLDTSVGTFISCDLTDDLPFHFTPFIYYRSDTSCECQSDYDCRSSSVICLNIQSALYQPTIVPYFMLHMTIPGLYTGCLPMNSLLESTLECFYNQTCVDQLASLLADDEHFSAIDLHQQSLFRQNSTMESILDGIMIEHWKSNSSYQDYYNHCKPVYCSYFVEERRSAMFGVTQIIGLLGGLTLILTLIVPKVVRYLRNRRSHNQSPSEPIDCE